MRQHQRPSPSQSRLQRRKSLPTIAMTNLLLKPRYSPRQPSARSPRLMKMKTRMRTLTSLLPRSQKLKMLPKKRLIQMVQKEILTI